ncbi:MAG: acyl-ACP--UDP-N-acetylglucosamine O-acyltransferase [Opitutales bacterium]|nr:acyl-ACP--UDP-N-acetylglucosamine O-acyltransferase [Opitutales bacterium]
MSDRIHPTAIIEEGARLHETVTVGPYAFVGAKVTLGARCEVGHHASIMGATTMGVGNRIFPYAAVGFPTQDLKFKGGEPRLEVGENNVFREFCTVHTATEAEQATIIGNENHLLAYIHIAHDCILGNRIIMSNNATLAGHVTVEDGVVMGGYAGVHQFVRVGRLSMLGGMSKITQDVPPFFIADGNPAAMRAVNTVGLERNGFTKEQVDAARKMYRIIYREKRNRRQAIEYLRDLPEAGENPYAAMITFLEKVQRGIVPGSS